jgi:hypothetical protein
MTLAEALAGILYSYSTLHPVAFGGNTNGEYIRGPGLSSTNAQDAKGIDGFVHNFLRADFFGELDDILFSMEDSVNTIVNLRRRCWTLRTGSQALR